ncbi:MAG: hypothetical protein AVDCRST_MAG02-978 [uncultured Rubrobacteraceae bacterium]|uniref:Uncharacterized protein n=1 Tax=uncultured Rubrobacteraceae bacterium TaxID=349277 RepID=A0A6J4QR37_9ACTN|nr:MAG: hypothetical protein AVDCRST_MAG02-978 [uncultured Rubrobacteraceae bacterium]
MTEVTTKRTGVKQESGEAKPMHTGQLVREMVYSVLSRQAQARAGRTGEPFGDALVAVRRTESGRQLEELRLGPHGAERADLWQRGLVSERAKERGRVWRAGRPTGVKPMPPDPATAVATAAVTPIRRADGRTTA